MLTVVKKKDKLWYLEYNGRFVESFDTKRDCMECKSKLERKGLVPS